MGPLPNGYSNYINGICGVVKYGDGECYEFYFNKISQIPSVFPVDVNVVVGSGVNDYAGDIEIYSKNNNSFEYGPYLPYPLNGAATVQYGDSLIVLGGVDGYCYCDNSGNMVVT